MFPGLRLENTPADGTGQMQGWCDATILEPLLSVLANSTMISCRPNIAENRRPVRHCARETAITVRASSRVQAQVKTSCMIPDGTSLVHSLNMPTEVADVITSPAMPVRGSSLRTGGSGSTGQAHAVEEHWRVQVVACQIPGQVQGQRRRETRRQWGFRGRLLIVYEATADPGRETTAREQQAIAIVVHALPCLITRNNKL